MSSTKTYRYSAIVNGKERSVVFSADAESWGHDLDENGESILNLASADLLIHDDGVLYERFYKGATQDDYEADHEHPELCVLVPSVWVSVEIAREV